MRDHVRMAGHSRIALIQRIPMCTSTRSAYTPRPIPCRPCAPAARELQRAGSPTASTATSTPRPRSTPCSRARVLLRQVHGLCAERAGRLDRSSTVSIASTRAAPAPSPPERHTGPRAPARARHAVAGTMPAASRRGSRCPSRPPRTARRRRRFPPAPGAGSGRRAARAPGRPARPAATQASPRDRRPGPRRTCGSRRGGRRNRCRRRCSSSPSTRSPSDVVTASPAGVTVPRTRGRS